jgi:hypothetical protein
MEGSITECRGQNSTIYLSYAHISMGVAIHGRPPDLRRVLHVELSKLLHYVDDATV